jgi:hypothetical protein
MRLNGEQKESRRSTQALPGPEDRSVQLAKELARNDRGLRPRGEASGGALVSAGAPRQPSAPYASQSTRSAAKRGPAVAEVIDLLDDDEEVQEVPGLVGGAAASSSSAGKSADAAVFSR